MSLTICKMIYLCLILAVSTLITHTNGQFAFTELSKIGIIRGRNYQLKIVGTPTTQIMVIKLIPNVLNLTQCNKRDTVLDDYKSLLTRVLKPINDSIEIMKSNIHSRASGVRFWGAVVGGVALGVATSAQITAGVALHNSIQNANAIEQLKDSIKNTNQAVTHLADASRRTVLAISALQDQINNNIVPTINQLGCDVALNTLRLSLNRYFSEISLIFGPNLRDPASQTLSIQAVSQSFNGDFESMLNTLNIRKDDFLDLLQSDSIRGRIIGVNMAEYWIELQIEYPDLITIQNAVVQEFNIISHNQKGTEWLSLFPRAILKRGNFLSNIDLNECSRTDISYICREDTSSPISPSIFNCATGKLSECSRSLVVNSYVPRFALLDGVVFANCVPITCICTKQGQHLIQDSRASNVMISADYCDEVQIDGIIITVGPRKMNRTMYAQDIYEGPPVSTNPIDISNQLGQIEESISKADEYIKRSNDILSRINPSIVNTGTMTFLIIISVVIIIWSVASLIWLITITKKQSDLDHVYNNYHGRSTVNSLSSLIPGM
nr:fusion protein [Bat paramyxovirus]